MKFQFFTIAQVDATSLENIFRCVVSSNTDRAASVIKVKKCRMWFIKQIQFLFKQKCLSITRKLKLHRHIFNCVDKGCQTHQTNYILLWPSRCPHACIRGPARVRYNMLRIPYWNIPGCTTTKLASHKAVSRKRVIHCTLLCEGCVHWSCIGCLS